MTNPRRLTQAKQGDIGAIASLIADSLRSSSIWVRIESRHGLPIIALESTQAPDADVMLDHVRLLLAHIQPQRTDITISGFTLGETEPDWEHIVELHPIERQLPPRPSKPIRRASAPDHTIRPGSQSDAQTRRDRPIVNRPLSVSPKASSRQLHPQLNFQRHQQRSLPHQPRTQQPFVLKWSDFDPVMLALIGFVAIYGFLGASNPSYDGPFIWLHYPNLAIHETGHLLFMPFGRFLMLLGGSLTQIVFPAAFALYFFGSRQYFSSALTLFWTGQNFMDVAVYMRDAPFRVLPLTVDSLDAHDWWQLFRMMGCLQHAGAIANLTHAIGVLIYIASVIAGLYFAYQDNWFAKHRAG